jgi:hypothetical protein
VISAKIEVAPAAVCRQQTKDKMASRKMAGLSEEEQEFLELHFYMIWDNQDISFEGNGAALYDFVAQESAAFVQENAAFRDRQGIVEREFLRLARAS